MDAGSVEAKIIGRVTAQKEINFKVVEVVEAEVMGGVLVAVVEDKVARIETKETNWTNILMLDFNCLARFLQRLRKLGGVIEYWCGIC